MGDWQVLELAGDWQVLALAGQAFAEPHFPQGFGGPVLTRAAMLIFAKDAAPLTASHVVGTSCRICPESHCPARRAPSILREGGG